MPDNILRVKFSGGLNDSSTNATEYIHGQQPDWKCPTFQNMRMRQDKAIQRKGQTPVGLGPYTDLQMLFWCKLNGQEFRLVVDNGDVKDDLTGALTGGTGRFTTGTECNATVLNGQVIIGNGIDPNVRFNGTSVTRLTVEPCDASGMHLTASSSGALSGTYQYLIVFLNADGIEGTFAGSDTTSLSGLSPTITVAGKQIALTNIPVCPAGQDCSGRTIYRNKGLEIGTNDKGTAFHFVATLNDNTTTTYTDTTADADLGDSQTNFPDATLLRSANTPFPPCRYFGTHQGRLLGAGCQTADSNTRTFHYSDDSDPTTSRLVSYQNEDFQGGRVVLSDRSAGDITAISEAYGNVSLVFTAGGMYQFAGDDNTNFAFYPFAPHGCPSHKAIAAWQNMLIWLTPEGVYTFVGTSQATFTGTSFRRISEDVRNTTDGMSSSDMANASAAIFDGRYYLCWPNGSLVCDLYYGGVWSADEPERFTHLTSALYTTDGRPRIYGYHPADQMVWQLETGTTDNGAAIPCKLRSADIALAGPTMNSRVIYYGGWFRTSSDTVSATLYRGTAQPVYTGSIDLSKGSLNADGNPLVGFDTTLFPLNTSRMRQRTPTDIDPVETTFALEFACNSTSGAFEVLEGILEWAAGGGFTG